MATIIIDVDGVCANLVKAVLRRYNREFGGMLKPRDIVGWEIMDFMIRTPQTELAFDTWMSDPSIYLEVKPYKGTADAIAEIRKSHKIVFATSPYMPKHMYLTPMPFGIKLQWLRRHGLITLEDSYVELSQKGLLRGGILLDDNVENLKSFPNGRILFRRPWNEYCDDFAVAHSWPDAIQKIRMILL